MCICNLPCKVTAIYMLTNRIEKMIIFSCNVKNKFYNFIDKFYFKISIKKKNSIINRKSHESI